MSTQTHLRHLEPLISVTLTDSIKQGLDQQIESFMATWMPQLTDDHQFRYVFDGLMCLGQSSSHQTEQVSQTLLARKLKQNNAKKWADIAALFEQFQQLLQRNDPAQKKRLPRLKKNQATQHCITINSFFAVQAVMYDLMNQIEEKKASLYKDNLYLANEHQALSTATQHNEQFLYIAEKLHERLAQWQHQNSNALTVLSGTVVTYQQYLQVKQYDLLLQKAVNLQAIQSFALIHENNLHLINKIQGLSDRLELFFHNLAWVQQQHQAQQNSVQNVQQKIEELQHNLHMIVQFLN